MSARLRAALPALVGLLLFVAALVVLRRELGQVSWHELSADLGRTSVVSLVAAVVLTAVNYSVLSGYDELKSVSDEWLSERAGAEKGFSLGFFDADYVHRFPVAVVERAGHVVAFATLWPGADGSELSMDLMRYGHDAPKDVMEALILNLLSWGRDQGYRWFSLGMAPLSGFETSPIAPLWTRWGSFIYKHGQAVYNFRGLRAYKEKFDPIWEPRYLAYPGGMRLPRILADVSALVAGGYRRIFFRA